MLNDPTQPGVGTVDLGLILQTTPPTNLPRFDVGILDIGIIVLYLIATRVGFGWWVNRKGQNDSEDYFLAGRSLAWPLIGLSFYVSNMSGSTFVGLPSAGYNDGIAVYAYEWLPALILIFFIFFILPFYLRARVFTAPQFLETRYGRNSKLAFSGFLLTANIFIDSAAALYAGGIVVKTLYPGVPLWITIAILSTIAAGYIFFGGLEAVVLNDLVQGVVIILGGTIVTIAAFSQIDSWSQVTQAAPPGAFHLIQPADDEVLPWPGLFTGVLIIGIYFWCTNQFIIQRALGARSLDHGRWGSLFAGLLKIPNLFILILPGVLATVLYPNLQSPDFVFPTLAFDLLPVGLRGLILAALIAAILSSLESILNSASTLFTMDFVTTFRPNTSQAALVNIGRVATIGFMVIAAFWAPQIARFPSLWQYLQSILSFVTPPIVLVFLAGIFWRRANRQGAFATIAVGVPLGVVGWLVTQIPSIQVFAIQFLYAGGVMLVISAAIMVAVSLATPAPEAEKVEGYTWEHAYWQKESAELSGKPWYLNYRYLSLGLTVVTLAVVIWFL